MLKDDDIITKINSLGQQTTIKGSTIVAPFFQAKELACRGSKILQCHDGFLIELALLRKRFGKPLRVNSCCRNPSHNQKVGGHPYSLHLTENLKHSTTGSLAIDISVEGWSTRDLNNFISWAKYLNWSIGHGYKELHNDKASGFIHIDRRVDIGLTRAEFNYNKIIRGA